MTVEIFSPAPKGRAASRLRAIWQAISVPVVAVLLAMLIGAVILWISGANPIDAYLALWKGSFGSLGAFGRTLEKATPLLFSGLAIAFAFQGGLFNIGAQGQLLLGAITAAAAGFALTGLPPVLHVAIALLAGGLAGGLFAGIPGAMRTYTGAHEVITTIMLNYVAINLTDYLADGPLKDRAFGNIIARTPQILDTARIPVISGIPLGFFLAVIAAIIAYWLLWRTTFGYEIRTVGLNPSAAKYAGIKVARTVILMMVVSGLLAGMGGAVETLGVVGRYQPGFNAGLGLEGITISLLGRNHPFGVIPAALLVGAMKAGSNQMQFDAGVAKEITDVIQALILFFVAADMIVRWLIRMRAAEGEAPTLTTSWGQQQ